jgi:crotonobetainyl-CoA:carnitine CoA-transferase CaiB-like acyl-CoA transferase
MKKPLEGLRVCDLSQNLAGPYCTQILADLGADVIKIEPPGGDPARDWGPPFWGDDGTLFLAANRGKRSVVLDLKTETGLHALYRLAETSDIFVQALRPGVAERLGFGYEKIRGVRGDIIYLTVSAFGPEGPLSHLPGYDPLMQAFTGVMSLTGQTDGPPARVGGSVVDFGTGMWGAIAIQAALRDRDRTGEGTHLDVALMDTSLIWVSYHLMGQLATGITPTRQGSGLASIAPYRAFETRDGHLMISAANDGIFARLCEALELPELAADPRFATNPLRVEHREALVRVLQEKMSGYGTAELWELLSERDVPCAPIQDVAQVVENEQVKASGMLPPAPNPAVDGYRDLSLPLRMGGGRPRAEEAPPAIGEHTDEVLRELGLRD